MVWWKTVRSCFFLDSRESFFLPLFFIGEDIIIIQGSYRLSQIKSEKDTIILDFPLRGYQSGTIYIKFYNCFIIS